MCILTHSLNIIELHYIFENDIVLMFIIVCKFELSYSLMNFHLNYDIKLTQLFINEFSSELWYKADILNIDIKLEKMAHEGENYFECNLCGSKFSLGCFYLESNVTIKQSIRFLHESYFLDLDNLV